MVWRLTRWVKRVWKKEDRKCKKWKWIKGWKSKERMKKRKEEGINLNQIWFGYLTRANLTCPPFLSFCFTFLPSFHFPVHFNWGNEKVMRQGNVKNEQTWRLGQDHPFLFLFFFPHFPFLSSFHSFFHTILSHLFYLSFIYFSILLFDLSFLNWVVAEDIYDLISCFNYVGETFLLTLLCNQSHATGKQ